MIQTLKPQRLKIGDTIGLLAPASSITEEQYENALAQLKKLGFKVKLGKHLRKQYGYLGGTDEQRLEDLHQMFEDKEVKGIWCARGGYGCPRLLPDLDYQLIRQNPKALVGYSDITALFQAIYQKTGLIGFHGPLAYAVFSPYTSHCLSKVLINPKEKLTIHRFTGIDEEEDYRPATITAGIAEGELIGGNLSVLTALSGTEFQLQAQGKLVFLEDIGEKPYRIDRMLTQLLHSGQLDGAKGILLGVFANCKSGPKSHFFPLLETFKDRLSKLGIPVFYGFSFGHIEHMCTLPIGVRARMDTEGQTLTLLESSVSG